MTGPPVNDETYEVTLRCACGKVEIVRRWKEPAMVNEFCRNEYRDLPYRCDECVAKGRGL